MKRLITLFWVIILCFLFTACTKTYSFIDDYQIIYDNVGNANQTFTKSGKKETLLEFDQYAYCSYLLLFPRQTPSELIDFDYYWSQSIDYDDYFMYFAYELGEDGFEDFKKAISEFSVSFGEQIKKPIYTESLFEYPTYILSWTNDVEHSGVCEYVMLDESTHTVVNVYKMFCGSVDLQEKADYNIAPLDNNYSAVEALCGAEDFYFAKHTGFSVYSFLDENNELFAPDVDELVYDNSFLNNV